jgi:peptide-methionine (S)-S-oxide reductase
MMTIENKEGNERTAIATLGGGCFWCLEAIYVDLIGVEKVISGYAGGHVKNPTYEQVCSKSTGHAEVVQITYDPGQITYEDILRIFFTIHDPTTKDRQGADVGPQYRSVIFYHDDDQRSSAEKIMAEISAAGIWQDPIVTQLEPLEDFYEAEAYHQDYFKRNPYQGYCQVVIAPKVTKFRQNFADRLKTGTK